jgi:hypothetical protein
MFPGCTLPLSTTLIQIVFHVLIVEGNLTLDSLVIVDVDDPTDGYWLESSTSNI